MTKSKLSISLSVVSVLLVIAVVLTFVGKVSSNKADAMQDTVTNAEIAFTSAISMRYVKMQNLMNALDNYAETELEAKLASIASAREAFVQAAHQRNIPKMAEQEDLLESEFILLQALIEASPELYMPVASYESLMQIITDDNAIIVYVRDQYNDAVSKYNKFAMAFPRFIMLALFGQGERLSYYLAPLEVAGLAPVE